MHCAARCSSGAGALLCSRGEAPVARREREREPPLQWVSNLRGVTTTSPPPLPRNTSKSPTFEGSPSITTKKPNQAPDKPSHCSNFFFTLKNIRVAPVNINWKKILEKNIASNTLAAEKSSLTFLTIQVAIYSPSKISEARRRIPDKGWKQNCWALSTRIWEAENLKRKRIQQNQRWGPKTKTGEESGT